jgi:hypothetical protein
VIKEMPVFTIDIDPADLEGVRHSINRMVQPLEHLRTVDLGRELSEWQVQDVHRNKPFTMRYRRAGRAQTTFRPHSWKQVKKSILYQKRGGKLLPVALGRRTRKGFLTAMARYHAFQPITSTRPYLRPELVEQLAERLIEMAREQLRW